MKFVYTFFLTVFIGKSCCASDFSIDEVIGSKTTQIIQIQSSCLENLAETYASRGELLLLSERYEDALIDFQASQNLLASCEEHESVLFLTCRCIFGQAILHAMRKDEKELRASVVEGIHTKKMWDKIRMSPQTKKGKEIGFCVHQFYAREPSKEEKEHFSNATDSFIDAIGHSIGAAATLTECLPLSVYEIYQAAEAWKDWAREYNAGCEARDNNGYSDPPDKD